MTDTGQALLLTVLALASGVACGGSNPQPQAPASAQPTPDLAATAPAPASPAPAADSPASPDLTAGTRAFDAGNYADWIVSLIAPYLGDRTVEIGAGHGTMSARLRRHTNVTATELRFIVEDSGPGIPAKLMDRIFEPFFTTKPVGQGTGLGLSVTLGIVQQLGGQISVENRSPDEGTGARFTVHLPIADGVVEPIQLSKNLSS